MTPTLEEISDFWQDVLWTRYHGDVVKAIRYVVNFSTMYPHTSGGQHAIGLLALLKQDLFDIIKNKEN